jgi:hypothetical protein
MKTLEEAIKYLEEHELYFSAAPIDDGKYVYKVSSRYYNIKSYGVSRESLTEAVNDFIQNLVEEIRITKEDSAKHISEMAKLIP